MLQEILNTLKRQMPNRVVTCPLNPAEIPGITAADALDADDCMGVVFEVAVPKSGIIFSALLIDPDDEGLQIDLELFNDAITVTDNDAAWAPSDADMDKFITELAFTTYNDHINSQTAELTAIDKAYSAPGGKVYIQAVTRGAHNIEAGKSPKIQLQIISTDSSFVEL